MLGTIANDLPVPVLTPMPGMVSGAISQLGPWYWLKMCSFLCFVSAIPIQTIYSFLGLHL